MLISASAFGADKVTLFNSQSGKKPDERGWLGLWKDRLAPVNVKFKQVQSPIADVVETEVEFIGVGEAGPMLLLKGLHPRAVKTVRSEFAEFTGEGAKVTGEGFELEMQRHGEAGFKLVLREGKAEQVLYKQDENDIDSWSFSWAGDVDGDGKLDFIIHLANHYNSDVLRLFLSSRAGKGELVKQVATSATSGC